MNTQHKKLANQMARLMEQKFRLVVLFTTTACLSMMLANILTLNFTILCMTEEKFRWENFTIDLSMDVFERVDFRSTQRPDSPGSIRLETDAEARTPSIPGFPDVEIPGIRVPAPGFNWQNFRLARQNPQLFLRLMKTVIVQAGEVVARRVGDAFNPREIDFSKFQNGFNLTDLNEDVILRVKDYILRKAKTARNPYDILDAEGRSVNEWKNITIDDVRLRNVTWNGIVRGEIRIMERPADFHYTNEEKAILFAIIAVGALIAIPFVSWSIRHFGCRKTFTVVGLISAASTALCPTSASAGFVVLVIVRCIQGVGFAACMPVIGAVTNAWAKLTENGLFNGALTCFIQLAPVIAMPISGVLCASSLRWPMVFYTHAFLTFVLILFWWYLYRDFPSESNHVLNAELRQIQVGKIIDGRQKHNRKRFPLKEICADRSVLAVWVAAVGNMYAIQTLILFGAIYISKVLRFPLVSVGFAAAIPTFLQFIVKIFVGILSDKPLADFNETQKLRIFNSIAFCGMATCFLLLFLCPLPNPNDAIYGAIDTEQNSAWHYVALVLLIAAAAILGFNVGGFFKSATLIGREYAYFINTIVQIIMCVAMLTTPFVIFALTSPDDSYPFGWACAFILLAILLFVTNVFFVRFGDSVAAPFTRTNNASSASLASGAVSDQTHPITENAEREKQAHPKLSAPPAAEA